MFKKVGLLRGLAGLLSTVMVFAIMATCVLVEHQSTINTFFGISTSKNVENSSGGESAELKYPPKYGSRSAANLLKIEQDAYAQTVKEAEEGTVLLKNGDKNGSNALPLAEGESSVTLFGHSAYDPVWKTAAASTRVTTYNPELKVDLKKALTDAGFDVNQELFNAYKGGEAYARSGYSFQLEEPLSFYTSRENTWTGERARYKQVAIVVLARAAGEGKDMRVDQRIGEDGKANTDFTSADVPNSLALQTREKEMLRMIKGQNFGKTIVLINTNYQMELGWLNEDEYGVDACLFIGTPGLTGFRGVVNILTGKVNPSGRTVSTFAADSLSSPAIINAAGNTPEWENKGDIRSSKIITDQVANTNYVSVQLENIYVGYKYYETRYADSIMNPTSNAQSEKGSSFGGGWDYAQEMCYPFGFGLSYTKFGQTIEDVSAKDENNIYTVKVKVENKGEVAGKCSVLLYVNTPYGAYEKQHKIEKAAILFVGFNKTDIIKPGESETVEIKVDEYLFASYDNTAGDTDTKGGYVLTAGEYYFAVGSDAHDALNNVLHVMPGAYTGLKDHEGEDFVPSAGKTTESKTFVLDTATYMYGEKGEPGENGEEGTAVRVKNQFDQMDINYWNRKNGLPEVTYLTREHWDTSFPATAQVRLQGAEMETLLQGDWYTKAADAPSTDIYAQGKSNNWKGVNKQIRFSDMEGVHYDNEKWDDFIDQFSLDDLVRMTGNNFGNKPLGDPIHLPEMYGADGCQGIGDKAFPAKYTDNKTLWACLYTSLLTCTFNDELMAERGDLMANEALYLEATVIWTGGGNLHRTPYGGRQAEYYSEDANLCYLVGLKELSAMEDRGILGGIKHFAGNDQESYREGVSTFYTEQAFREGALRGFEGALRKGQVKAVMQAFNRQGVIYSSSCYALNVSVLREEWKFMGHTITDASSGAKTGYKAHYTTSITNGTDAYCLDGDAKGGAIIADSIKDNDDGYLLAALRRAAKNVTYALTFSAAVDVNADIVLVTPVWLILTYTGMGLTIALGAGSIAMFIVAKLSAAGLITLPAGSKKKTSKAKGEVK